MIRTLPWRLMTLHLAHLTFTDAETFMLASPTQPATGGVPDSSGACRQPS
jgi:hypothetical protein